MKCLRNLSGMIKLNYYESPASRRTDGQARLAGCAEPSGFHGRSRAARHVCLIKMLENDYELCSCHFEKGAGRALKSGGMWIYDNEIDQLWEALKTEILSVSGILTATLWARAL